MVDLDTMVAAAIETLLWSETIVTDRMDPWGETPQDGDPFDDWFSADDLSAETLAEVRSDCEGFLAIDAVRDAIEATGLDASSVGHNFILTRNRHGAGFWDLGLGEHGRTLTTWAHSFGSFNLYLDNEGKVYHGG